jgi:site-specific DNA recombinase
LEERSNRVETCVIYCRDSDPNTTSTDESFENQEDACREFAARKGYEVVKVYREAHSGADLLNRPMIWDAMDDIKNGIAQVLLVRNWDRIARKVEHQGVILYEVEDKGHGRVEAALEPEESPLMRAIKAAIAEGERASTVARMERGKQRRVARGHLPGMSNPLYGYAWDQDVPGKRTGYVIDEEAAGIVRRIFQLAISGYSLRQIARLLNAEGVPTKSKHNQARGHIGRRPVGDGWRAGQVRRVVSERAYIGEGEAYRWQQVKRENGKVGTIARPADYTGRVKIAVPTLIDQATFDAANAAARTRHREGRPPIDAEASWLRGHVWCGCCGDKMAIKRTSDGKYNYRCRNRKGLATTDRYCPGGDFAIRSHALNQPVYEALAHILMYRERLQEVMLSRLGSGKQAALVSMAESFQAQLTEKREELDGAMRMAQKTKDEELANRFLHQAEELNTAIHQLEQGYAQTREQLDNWQTGNAWIESTLKRIYDLSPIREAPTPEDIRAFSLEERRLLLAASGLRADVYPKNWTGEIQQGFHFGPTVQVTKGPNGERIEREVEPRAKQSKRVQVFLS